MVRSSDIGMRSILLESYHNYQSLKLASKVHKYKIYNNIINYKSNHPGAKELMAMYGGGD